MPTNAPAVQAAWTTAKAQLASLKSDLSTVLTNLANLETSRDSFYNLGAGDVADWLSTQIQQVLLGYQPRISAGGGTTPQVIGVRAADPKQARDFTTVDQRPITITSTGEWANLC